MTRSISTLACLLACLMTTSGAFAQGLGNDRPEPAEVARRCVAQMERVADHTAGVVGDATQAALGHVARLDRAGASDREIIAAGNRGTQAVTDAAVIGTGRVVRVEEHCVALLTRLGADRAMIQRVRDTAAGFREEIGMVGRRGVSVIRDAVARATR